MNALDTYLTSLLEQLSPSARRALAREVAKTLRKSQQKRIAAQQNPDGSEYEPRHSTARSKSGRIKRQMFAKLKTTKYLKMESSSDSASVQFAGQVQRIARVHHFGLRDRVDKKGPLYQYPKRELLGFTDEDVQSVTDIMLKHLSA